MDQALVPFTTSALQLACNSVRDETPSNVLAPFIRIGTIVSRSIGNVPSKVIPMLNSLIKSHSEVNSKVKQGLSSTSATTSQFLIKSALVLQRGYNDRTLSDLERFSDRLNGDYVTALDAFVESSRSELLAIALQLTSESHGGVAARLAKRRQELESAIEGVLKIKGQLQIQLGEAEGNFAAFQSRITYLRQLQVDKAAAKASLTQEIRQLQSRIPEYEAQILQHKNRKREEWGRFFIFSWKVRDVYEDNGEHIARENLQRLMQRIAQTQALMTTLDDAANVQQDLQDAEKGIPIELQKITGLRAEIAQKDAVLQHAQQEFNQVLANLKAIYEATGASDLDTLTMVDDLARSVRDGVNALTDAYGNIRTSLKTVSSDPDLLVLSVQAGVHLLALSDEFLGGKALERVKTWYAQIANA